MSQGVVRRHGATATMTVLPGQVLKLRMQGVLSAPVLGGFASDAVAMYGRRVRGFVLDYTAAIVAVSPDDLASLYEHVPAGSPLYLPGAFVCRPSEGDLFRRHAIQMACAGFLRRTFLDVDDAHVWAVRQIERKQRIGQG